MNHDKLFAYLEMVEKEVAADKEADIEIQSDIEQAVQTIRDYYLSK